jgi:hypothetical protein
LYIDEWGILGNQFSLCTHEEVAMLLNGIQVYSRSEQISTPMAEGGRLRATIPIEKGEIK